MSDPLSVTASVAGLVSLAIQVTQGIHDYYSAFRDQNESISRLCSSLNTIITALDTLGTALENRKSDSSTEEKLVQGMKASISDCNEVIEDLQTELDHIKPSTNSDSIKGAIKATGRRLAYPFRESTLKKLHEYVEELRENISFALNILQLFNDQRAADERNYIKDALELVRAAQLSQNVREWLKAPDLSVNHSEACNKRHPTSGLWFLESPDYKSWLHGNGPWLWLNGFAGCGKSVLCSSIINDAIRHKTLSASRRVAVCYFYFTFSDNSKQDVSAMLRAITLQLSHQASDGNQQLEKLYNANRMSSPSNSDLLELLQLSINRFDDVYFLMDAIDESPLETAREPVLTALSTMYNWKNRKLHILLTSRDERDIRAKLDNISQSISMENQGVDGDISKYVREHLKNDSFLWSKWSKFHVQIEQELSERAKGVFRWVECQFRSLARCPVSKRALEKLLNSLPQSLDQTYERMLLNINPVFQEQARYVFTLLCFATRPMFVQEVIEYLAFHSDEGEELDFDPECQYRDENDLLEICPGFLHISEDVFEYMPARKLQIAHFSVQEYLLSERIRSTSVSTFFLQAKVAHAQITQTWLAYFRYRIPLSHQTEKNKEGPCAIGGYAMRGWAFHCRQLEPNDKVTSMVLDFLDPITAEHYDFLLRLLEFKPPHGTPPVSSLHSAARLGLPNVVRLVIDQARAGETRALKLMSRAEVFAFRALLGLQIEELSDAGQPFSTALHVAVLQEDIDMIELLLELGMDVNIDGRSFNSSSHNDNPDIDETPLSVAICYGSVEIIRLLISQGADINLAIRKLVETRTYLWTQNTALLLDTLEEFQVDKIPEYRKFFGLLLYDTIREGNVHVMKRLLSKGLDITQHKIWGDDRCVLSWALGHTSMRKTGESLVAGSDELTSYENQLARSYEMFDVLFEHMAQMSGKTSCCPEILTEAVEKGHLYFIKKIAKGVQQDCDTVKCSEIFTSAAIIACLASHFDILQLLLHYSVDSNCVIRRILWREKTRDFDNFFGESIETLSFSQLDRILKFLIDNGTCLGVDERLVAACFLGDLKTVQSLAVHDERSTFCLPLMWAAVRENLEIVKELLVSRYTVASWSFAPVCGSGNVTMVKQYLATGINMSDIGGEALVLAARSGSVDNVKLLLESGADFNRAGYTPSTPDPIACHFPEMEAAIWHEFLCYNEASNTSSWGHEQMWPWQPLQIFPMFAACLVGDTDMVKFLLEAGASVDPGSGFFDSGAPLCAAITSLNPDCVELLCEAGAALEDADEEIPDSLLKNRLFSRIVSYSRSALGFAVSWKQGRRGNYGKGYYLKKSEADVMMKIMEILIRHGAEINDNVLRRTCDDTELLQFLHYHMRLREQSSRQATAIE